MGELSLLEWLHVSITDRPVDVEMLRRAFAEARQLLRGPYLRIVCISAPAWALSAAEKERIEADCAALSQPQSSSALCGHDFASVSFQFRPIGSD